jgi:hypothetical protein
MKGLAKSCKEILREDNDAPNGEYYLANKAGDKFFKAYCEMSLNGGGYTHLHPSALDVLIDEDVQAMFTDKNSFVLRVQKTNCKQTVAILKQHTNYK